MNIEFPQADHILLPSIRENFSDCFQNALGCTVRFCPRIEQKHFHENTFPSISSFFY